MATAPQQAEQQTPVQAPAPRTESINARDPADLRALLWFLLVTVVGVVAASGAEQTTAGLEGDLVQMVSHLPDPLVILVVIGVGGLHLLLALGIPLAMAFMRRWRQLGIYLLGLATTSLLLRLGERLVSPDSAAQLPDFGLALQATTQWPPSGAVATVVTGVVLLSPHLSRPWRRFGWGYAALVALQLVVTSQDVLLDTILPSASAGPSATRCCWRSADG